MGHPTWPAQKKPDQTRSSDGSGTGQNFLPETKKTDRDRKLHTKMRANPTQPELDPIWSCHESGTGQHFLTRNPKWPDPNLTRQMIRPRYYRVNNLNIKVSSCIGQTLQQGQQVCEDQQTFEPKILKHAKQNLPPTQLVNFYRNERIQIMKFQKTIHWNNTNIVLHVTLAVSEPQTM